MNKSLFIFLSIVLLVTVFSCRKDSFITSKDAMVNFSADTLFFDTVFTTAGSITQSVKIINVNNQKLRLTDIKLMGGSGSAYSINIDGLPGPEQDNLELDAGDSLYIFVAVRINPQQSGLPFIVQDSIAVDFNGNRQFIQLQAYGQSARFFNNAVITSNTVWDNSLPYVILNSLRVDTGVTLTIPAGCKVYFHNNAPLLVDGSLQVTGDKYDSTRVYFRGDRLDDPYRYFPGSWPGIYFRASSTNNHLQYASILNASQAIVDEAPPSGAVAKVLMEQCIIDNSYQTGILGIQGSLQANNCLISNCGQNILLGGGGSYQFVHCTGGAYSTLYLSHALPVLSVSDTYQQNGLSVTGNMQASFVNCIFWGVSGIVSDEVTASRQSNAGWVVGFTNCLWKVQTPPAGVTTTGMVSLDPLFDSVNVSRNIFDFHLQAASPAVDKGVATPLTIDLDGNPRPVGAGPDLGCYERQ